MDAEPVACSLPADEATRQVSEWAELRLHATDARRVPGGVALSFPPDVAAAAEDLAAREAACCSFLTIATSRTQESVRVEITSAAPGADAVIDLIAGN